MTRGLAALVLLALAPGLAAGEPPLPQASPAAEPIAATRSGREIYQRFREGLADPDCSDSSERC